MVHNTLLGVEIIKVSSKFIYQLRKQRANPESVFDILPEYVLNEKHNNIQYARYFLQYVGTSETEAETFYYMMNYNTLDSNLDYELNETGKDTFMTQLNITPILDKLVICSESVLSNHGFPTVNYLMVNINIEQNYDYYNGGFEYDVECYLDGYLDKDFKPKKLTKPKK